ncbi:hypothetical protein B0A55_07930 [Friedmanniomyces simplex]|uniref:M serotype protein n=1 Tax=Friedmanniomyces simplex TaxID=329884 RepID=A0A4U0X628_9PEZI|nr:hypothetical protein B0A55_07930 [Friedmanniomyces simplex]
MSSATPKKPATPAASNGVPRRPSANPTPTAASNNGNNPNAPSRSPSRMAPQASLASSGTATGVNRTRSIRNGAPVSARAAARKPQGETDVAAEDAKAEMQAEMDELHERLQHAEQVVADSQKQASYLQMKLEEALKDQSTLEESVHEQTERIEELENERKENLRAKREFEQIYEAERVAAMKEREEAGRKEEEMQHTMQRMMKERGDMRIAGLEDGHGHGHRPSVSRNSSFRSSTTSPNPMESGGGQFAPPSSLQRSDSRSSSKLVMQKDKIIEGLRLELAEAQIKLVEVENMGGGRLQQLQKETMDIKMQNARLMEENESFQLLLSEKTLNGDFAVHSDLLHPRPPSNAGSRPPSRHPNAVGATLADELASDADSMVDGVGYGDEQTRKLQAEVNSTKDQNKALTLYINNIISRLLQHDQFEAILDKTPDMLAGPGAASVRYAAAASAVPASADTEKELPPPPPPREKEDKSAEVVEEQQAQPPVGFLQRAKSVMGGRRPRPTSYAVSSSDQEKLQQQLKSDEPRTAHEKLQHQLRADEPPRGAHENPDTAPRIPINRSNSSRGSSAHRRANSEWPATAASSVVGSMYRGSSPALQGPVSPGLSSPVGRNGGFFAQPLPLGSRVPSVGAAAVVPTIPEDGGAGAAAGVGGKENEAPGYHFLAQRDSKVPAMASHRSSVISNSGGGGMLDINSGGDADTSGPADHHASSSSGPSSPPRSTTSSGERDTRSGGAVMMGSKPRPLRLVQEAAAGQDDATRKAANRGSWFGWMNKGAAAGQLPGPGGRSVSGGGGGGTAEGGVGQ